MRGRVHVRERKIVHVCEEGVCVRVRCVHSCVHARVRIAADARVCVCVCVCVCV